MTIKEKVWNNSTQDYDIVEVNRVNLLGKNYYKVPEAYCGPGHIIDIIGNSNSGTVVTLNGFPIAPPNEWICSWYCNGSNYAYGLDMIFFPLDGTKIKMSYPPAPLAYPYYYQWVSNSGSGTNNAWNVLRNNRTPNFYGLGGTNWGLAQQNAGARIISINVPQGQYKLDEFGSPINGPVIGIAKAFGPYENTWDYISSDFLTVSENECAQPMNWAIGQVNMGSNNPVNISCQGTSGNTSFTENPAPVVDIADPLSDDPCVDTWYQQIGVFENGVGLYHVLLLPCFSAYVPGQGSGAGVEWPENISRVSIKSMYNRTQVTNLSFVQSDIFDDNNNFIGDNLNVPSGLYTIIYEYVDGSIASYYIELPTITNSTIQDKDYLTYNTYPVPIVGNEYNISFESAKELSFTYELRDSQNNLLFKDNFNLEKDFEVIKTISVSGDIPTGLLFNKFIFADGSIINFTTVK